MSNLKRDVLIWFVWFPLRELCRFIPLRFAYFLANIGGFFLYVFSRKKTVMKNELTCLFSQCDDIDSKRIKKITFRGLITFCKRQLENIYLGSLSPSQLEQLVSIEGIEHLQNSLNEKKGAILLLSHFGSHLYPPLLLGYKGYKVNQIAGVPLVEKQSPIHKKVFELRLRESAKLPINFIVLEGFMREVFTLLGNNELLFIAFDGKEAKRMVPVDFFGRKVCFAPGPFKISLKTGAPILPVFTIRHKGNRQTVIIEPPFELASAETTEEAVTLSTAKFARKFEDYVLKYPCHYAMTLMREKELSEDGVLT